MQQSHNVENEQTMLSKNMQDAATPTMGHQSEAASKAAVCLQAEWSDTPL